MICTFPPFSSPPSTCTYPVNDALIEVTRDEDVADQQFKLLANLVPGDRSTLMAALGSTISAASSFNGVLYKPLLDIISSERATQKNELNEAQENLEDSKGRIEAARD